MAEPGAAVETAAQQTGPAPFTHRGTRAVQRMVEHAPCSGGLALWVRHEDVADSGAAATPQPEAPAWTDGLTVYYRPAFAQLPLPRQTAWVAHEVLHVALRHAPRFQALQARLGQADLQLFNVCADAIVNSTLSHLGWLQLPTGAVQLDGLLASVLGQHQSAEAALLAWDVERLYQAVDDRRPLGAAGSRNAAQAAPSGGGENRKADSAERERKGEGEGDRGSSAGLGSSAHVPAAQQPTAGSRFEDGPRAARTRALAQPDAADLQPGTSGQVAPEDEAAAARAWGERLLRAQAGDGEQSMLRALLADLPRQRTPWEQVLRTQLARGLTHKPGLSWSRPARSWLANQGRTVGGRRLPWEPGTSGTRPAARLVVVVDVSGSIEAPLMQRFAGEIEALSRRLEAALVLVVGDDRVQHVHSFEPGRSSLRDIRFHGGGGTDFTPLLEEAQRHQPDITVVLTDLEGPARFRPRCPVIWVVPEACRHAMAPFGRLLVLH
jgi:hypothetical protein